MPAGSRARRTGTPRSRSLPRCSAGNRLTHSPTWSTPPPLAHGGFRSWRAESNSGPELDTISLTRRAQPAQRRPSPLATESARESRISVASLFFFHRAQQRLHFAPQLRIGAKFVGALGRHIKAPVQFDFAAAPPQHHRAIGQERGFGDGMRHKNYG